VPITADQLQDHLAYEVHYLVWSAVGFRNARGKDKVAFQDSALMHARNLLEFTKPKRPRFGWWIVDVGAPTPKSTDEYDQWNEFINSKVTHLGDGRLRDTSWPVPKDGTEVEAAARYALARVCDGLPEATGDPRMSALLEVSQLGVAYLDNPATATIDALADLVG
jgi:hypothetical protein